MILIIGSSEEYHSRFIHDKIIDKKIKCEYLDSRKYPVIAWELGGEKNYIKIENNKIYIKDISGIYWRWYYGINYDTDFEAPDMVQREKESALESFLASAEKISFNSIQAIELHRKKSLQSKLIRDNNIRIPKTLITNDKEALEDFYIANNKSIIYKPVRGGAYTKKITDEDLKRSADLINCPCQLQEFIDGIDIRVYAFSSGEIFAGEILAKDIDFREDNDAVINRVELPKKIKKDCLKVMKLLELKYSGIDIRLSKSGEYVFIEANPAPMFVHFENITGYPISDTLIRNLIR